MKIVVIKDKENIHSCTEKPGMYRLYRKTEVGWKIIYLGISNNIRRRLFEHIRTKEFDAFYCEEINYEEAKKMEKELLKSYVSNAGILPELNQQIG